jgi:transcriptional regulator with XRE-family HTH domain
MTSSLLPNHLRANRKRLSLSQEEVAFLLGTQSGAKVCRYERFVREPNLETILAYEAIFQKPARELFAGLYQKIEQDVAARAKVLALKKVGQKPNQQALHRRQALAEIAAKEIDRSIKP